jgi:hypothetical protein
MEPVGTVVLTGVGVGVVLGNGCDGAGEATTGSGFLAVALGTGVPITSRLASSITRGDSGANASPPP